MSDYGDDTTTTTAKGGQSISYKIVNGQPRYDGEEGQQQRRRKYDHLKQSVQLIEPDLSRPSLFVRN